MIGKTIGPYHVAAKLGEGGMGEVYRATDTNLKRQVAIKVLPDVLAADPDRLARFQREAEVLAALNHPNIATIYGLEKSGDMTALVMELVDGPTLADLIGNSSSSAQASRPAAHGASAPVSMTKTVPSNAAYATYAVDASAASGLCWAQGMGNVTVKPGK